MRASFFLLLLVTCLLPWDAIGQPDGRKIYAVHCASCHGAKGEGVADEYEKPLWGNKSVDSLTRYIHKSMPEEKEDAVVDEDARAVARYIHDAFYGPAAQARNRPQRIELLRLTNNQYRQSAADLIESFKRPQTITANRGLRGRYFNVEKMNKEKESVLERIDPAIDFDWGTGVPADKINQEGFSIRWAGSLLAPQTGLYQFRIKTHNSALFLLNSFRGDDDKNAFIDAYVNSRNKLHEKTGRMFLLGGRGYPLYLRYFTYKEKVASLRLEWKPPHGIWEPIPNEYLMPEVVDTVTVVGAPFPPDDRSRGYERGAGVSKEWQEATTYAAVDLVNHLITYLNIVSGLNEKQRKDPAALRRYAHEFASRAFRRPLNPEQKRTFVDSRFEQQSDPYVALRHSMLLVLTSPRFLYPGLAENKGRPDSYTIASRLALTLWDGLPDQVLLRAAREDKLRTPEQISAQIRRMVQNRKTRRKMQGFFRHWLAMDEREDLRKDPELYPEFDSRLVIDLRRSLERFVDEVVWSESSDYRQLLLDNHLFLNQRLASYYQADSPPGSEFQKVALPGDQRSGILTHPFLLSLNSYHDNTSPIHRGVFLSRQVLGRLLKPPPEAVAFKNEEFDPSLTMREKVTELTKADSCMQCHRVINPVGFSLENFDATGRYRSRDNERPINTVSNYTSEDEEKIRISSARDLANLAAGSKTAHRAFITHLFHHFTKQSIDAYGPGTLESLRAKFTESGYNIRSLLVELTALAASHQVEGKPLAAQ